MKSIFLRSIKLEEHVEKVETAKQSNEEHIPVDWFDNSDYEDTKIIRNTDGFKKYNFDYKYIVTHKQARTMIEEKRPFVVSKNGKRKGTAEEVDIIYHTSPKMNIENKSVQRLGFVVADTQLHKFRLTDNMKKKFKGVVNDEYMIFKKKPFNMKKVGYIKLEESTSQKNLYVEVVQKRGYKWLAILLLILFLIYLFLHSRDYTGWHIDLSKFAIYKTREITEYKERELVISLNATPVLDNNTININLTSEQSESNITYFAKLYIKESGQIIFQSEELKAGEGISKIESDISLSEGEYNCVLECESYRDGNFLGIVTSDLVLKVR